jgi:ribosomal protein L25 (general stress protein Ctc)
MAAQEGSRDKILRLEMPFEIGRNSMRNSRAAGKKEGMVFGDAIDPWSVVLRVRSWTSQLREGRVHSCSEIAKNEGITRARVSQLWPLSEITQKQVDEALIANKGRGLSIRRLISIARIPNARSERSGAKNMVSG